MNFLLIGFIFASVQLAATMSPGPAFVMTVRNSIAYNRAVGVFTAVGLGLGVAVHCIAFFAGFSIVLVHYPLVYEVIKYFGGAYLVYLGFNGLKARPKSKGSEIVSFAKNPVQPWYKFVVSGMVTNVFNPKAWVFFPTFLLQFSTPQTPIFMFFVFGITSTLIEIAWFSAVSVVLTNANTRHLFLSFSHWIERVCGGLLIALGVRVIFEKSLHMT